MWTVARPRGSSVRGILQARILKWVDMIFTRGSSSPSDQTCNSTSPSLPDGFFITTSAIWEALKRVDIN